MKKKRVLIEGTGSSIILVVLASLAIVSLLVLPFVTYKDQNKHFSISGLEFIKGAEVFRNSASSYMDSQTGIFTPALTGTLLILIAALAFGAFFLKKNGELSRKSYKNYGRAIIFSGLLIISTPVVFMYNAGNLLKAVKNHNFSIGAYITLVAGFLILCYGISVMYRNKSLNMLDFMVLPGLVYVIINNYIPMTGIILAFKKLNVSTGLFSSPWAGLDNFRFLFSSNDAWIIIRNTVGYNLAFIVLGNLTAIFVAIALNECFSKVLKRVSQTLILLPQLMSWVIIAYIVYGFLATDAGWINKTLLQNLPNIPFYSKRGYWPFILILVYLWQGMGYRSIIYLSSIVGIDRSLYEAAYIDGCSKFKQITKITIPMLKPTIITLCILAVGRIMSSDFGLFYQTTQNSGALYKATQTIDVYVYRAIMETQSIEMGAAAAAFQSVVGFTLIMLTNTIIRKLDERNALF